MVGDDIVLRASRVGNITEGISSCGVAGGSSSVDWEVRGGEYGEDVANSVVVAVDEAGGGVGRMCCLGGRFLGGR